MMRLENEHSKYFEHEYPENHPQIIICGDNSQEIQDLLYAIDSFFKPIENSLKVKYDRQFQVKYNKVYLDIGNQYTKKAVKAVQNAKKELKNFIDNYNKHSEPTPVWEVVLSTAVTTLIVVLTLIFNLSTKTWKGSHKKKCSLNPVRSTLILLEVTILIAVIFIIVVDRTSIFQKFQEFQLSSLLQPFSWPSKPPVTPSEQLVMDYYEDINKGDYKTAWNKLPINIKDNLRLHPKGYLSFEQWFKKIVPVNVESIKMIDNQGGTAVVNAYSTYNIEGQPREQSINFTLIFDKLQNQWMIESIILTFPKDICGDELPGDLTAYPVNFYGVFIKEYTERNLNQVKSHLCKDAFQKNQIKIQVASILGKDRANTFKRELENDEIFKRFFRGVKVEVGDSKKIEWDDALSEKKLRHISVNWKITAKELNCRMLPQYQDISRDSLDTPEILYKNTYDTITNWKVMNKFKTGQRLRAVKTELGKKIILLEKEGKPWIRVESQLGDLSNCFVRADSQFIAPIPEDPGD
jgi:hypothetical protein